MVSAWSSIQLAGAASKATRRRSKRREFDTTSRTRAPGTGAARSDAPGNPSGAMLYDAV